MPGDHRPLVETEPVQGRPGRFRVKAQVPGQGSEDDVQERVHRMPGRVQELGLRMAAEYIVAS